MINLEVTEALKGHNYNIPYNKGAISPEVPKVHKDDNHPSLYVTNSQVQCNHPKKDVIRLEVILAPKLITPRLLKGSIM